MDNDRIHSLLERVKAWPSAAQEELEQLVTEIEADIGAGAYRPSTEELRGIDRGLRDAEQKKFATDEEVETTFAKYRPS
jgi:hypothetical protein